MHAIRITSTGPSISLSTITACTLLRPRFRAFSIFIILACIYTDTIRYVIQLLQFSNIYEHMSVIAFAIQEIHIRVYIRVSEEMDSGL